MAKEKTILINMRIPTSILKAFDEVVAGDPLVSTRTAKIVNMMHAEIMRNKRKKGK